jgi:hypothetical protein
MTNDLTTASAAASSAHGAPAGRAAWRRYLPAAAGLAYLTAWVVGLSVWPVNLALNATAAQEAASHAAHPAEAATQYLLAEGLAGLLLAVVLGSALLPRLRARVSRRAVGGAAILSAVAVVVSLTQCVIGLVLTSAAVDHDVATSGELFRLLNRLDGVKMLALAITAVCLAAVKSPSPVLPRWLRATAVLLTVALAASGYAYLTLTNSLAWTAYVSGVLLIVWVTGTGIALTIRHRRLGQEQASIDRDHRSGGIAVPHQEQDSLGDLLRLSQLLDEGPRGGGLEQGLPSRLGDPGQPRGQNDSRPDSVDANRGQLDREPLGQGLDGAGTGVRERGPARGPDRGRPGRQGDRPSRPDPGGRMLDRGDRTPETGLEYIPGRIQRDAGQRSLSFRVQRASGRVDQVVQFADPLDEGGNAVLVVAVDHFGGAVIRQLSQRGAQPLRAAGSDGHRCAGRRRQPSGRQSDARTAPNDQNLLVGQAHGPS